MYTKRTTKKCIAQLGVDRRVTSRTISSRSDACITNSLETNPHSIKKSTENAVENTISDSPRNSGSSIRSGEIPLSTPVGHVDTIGNNSNTELTKSLTDGDQSNSINSDSESDISLCINENTDFNNHPSMSYSTRRRHVRKLKDCFNSIHDINEQAKILSEFLNDTDILPILRAGGMIPPKEATINSYLVKQLMKQVNRSSSKESSRGRINDDMQSYRINAIGLITKTPESTSEVLLEPKDIRRILYSNTSIPDRTVRRLVKKAEFQRLTLTKREKGTTWSIITHRKGYNTKQSSLNASLFEWVLNHPHVIASPIYKDTVIVNVPNGNGEFTKERVGKLLLEISVRELHDDMMKDPPIGFSDAYCKSTNKLLISERYLRNMLPPQLKPISEYQKQMCGCECCTVMRMHHESLLKFRKRECEQYSQNSTTRTRSKSLERISFNDYLSEIMVDNRPVFPKARDVLKSMTCEIARDQCLPRWKCVMGRCTLCPFPSLPQMELLANSPLRTICYGAYRYHSKCKLHGLLSNHSNICDKCTSAVDLNLMESPEKIVRRKEITLLESSIYSFHNEVYIPMLHKFKYHIAIVSILNKNYCKKMRCDAFKNNLNWIISERDYAERLVKQLDGEIQSDHFGDNASLSIEGCTLQYHKNPRDNEITENESNIKMDFHSHFADYSRQDAATTFEHMCVMLENHISVHGPLPKKCVFLDHTDGCAKQYRSGNALYLLNMLCIKYDIIIDRAICAPGHGKSIIDGMNAVDKHYLRKVMCISGSTRYDDLETRMDMFAMKKNMLYPLHRSVLDCVV